MSTRLLSAVWYGDLDVDHTELVVLLSLADQANDDGVCWPSNRHTSNRCRLHIDTVLDVIHRLESRGYLTIKRTPGKSNLYTVTIPEPTAQDRTHLRSTTVTPTAHSRNTYGSHSGGTIKNHQDKHSARIKRDIETAKANAIPMPDNVRAMIPNTHRTAVNDIP